MKKIILTLGLCLSFNQISFGCSDALSASHGLLAPDLRKLEELAENVSRLNAAMHISAYCESGDLYQESPSRYTPVSDIETLLRGMQRQQRDALVQIIQENGEIRNVKKFVRFVLSSQERQSPLLALRSFSGDDIKALWRIVANPTIQRSEASSSKNIAAIALRFEADSGTSRASESGFSRQVDGPIGSQILQDILKYDLTEHGLGDAHRPTAQWSIIENILTYVKDVWIDPNTPIDPDEALFLSSKKSHFLNTINAAKTLINAKDNLVTFGNASPSTTHPVIYSGAIYNILNQLQQMYDETNIPNSIAHPEFEGLFQQLSQIAIELQEKIANGSLFSKEELRKYANFEEFSGQEPIVIEAGEIKPIVDLLKKYTTAKSISPTKEPSRTKQALLSFNAFLNDVQQNLVRNIASRRCSEQQLVHHIWTLRHEIKQALEQGTPLSPLYMSTDRSPCTTCLMTTGRLNKEMTNFLGQEFCTIIGYREDYHVESADRRLYHTAAKFAQRHHVTIRKNSDIMGSPERKPSGPGTHSTPITHSNEKNIGELRKIAQITPERLGSVQKILF